MNSLLDIKTGESFNVLAAVIKDSKVVALREFDSVDGYMTQKLKEWEQAGYTTEVYELRCRVEIPVEMKNARLDISRRWRAPYPNGKGINRVRCVETGEVFDTVSQASASKGIPIRSIYKAINRVECAYGFHFEYLVDKVKNGRENNKSEGHGDDRA